MSRQWSRRYRRRYVRRPRSLFRKLLDYVLTAAILGLLVLISARLDRVNTRQATGMAIINDGDSVTLGAERVRLRGIDAPEFSQTCEKNGTTYPCGRRSREALVRLIGGKPVSCTGWERDRYDRLLGSCSAGGTDLNRAQVEAGWAVAYGDYFDVQEEAREKTLGLWAGSFDRPRDWRDSHGERMEGEHDLKVRILNWLRQIFRFS
jgi:endonuclease YncB( thermonuclease family)